MRQGPINQNVTIEAISWNMGNQTASNKVVDEFAAVLHQNGLPDVLAISTQEEGASPGYCLHEKLLTHLNQGLPKGKKYKLVKVESHITLAGSQIFNKALQLSLTGDNRCCTAVLVKEPCEMRKVKTQVDYADNKRFKSVISIQGIVHKGKNTLPITVAGGHFHADSEAKRRKLSNHFLKSQRMKSGSKSYDEICKEAIQFRVIMGDFNERRYLNQDKSTSDKSSETNLHRFGFDMSLAPTQKFTHTTNSQSKTAKALSGKQLQGTYGYHFDSNMQEITNDPDKKRPEFATEGYLDKASYTSGCPVTRGHYGMDLNPEHFKKNKKGKWLYHGSDHLPVMASFQVTPPSSVSKTTIAKRYLNQRMPDFHGEIDDLTYLIENCTDLPSLRLYAKRFMSYNPVLTDNTLGSSKALNQILQQMSGASMQSTDEKSYHAIMSGLIAKRDAKIIMQEWVEDIKNRPISPAKLTELFNMVTQANVLKNELPRIMAFSEKKLLTNEKAEFKRLFNNYIDMIYANILRPRFNFDVSLSPQATEFNQYLVKHHKSLKEFTKLFHLTNAMVSRSNNTKAPEPKRKSIITLQKILQSKKFDGFREELTKMVTNRSAKNNPSHKNKR
ncbi:MAG: hypothetical protein AB7I18_04235 [Candidatus Berkiella sp.]